MLLAKCVIGQVCNLFAQEVCYLTCVLLGKCVIGQACYWASSVLWGKYVIDTVRLVVVLYSIG